MVIDFCGELWTFAGSYEVLSEVMSFLGDI